MPKINFKMTKIISLINSKGGVAKTTTACSLASALSLKNKQVLLIDLDPQGNLSQSLGIGSCDNNIYQCLKGECKFSPVQIMMNLDLVPSTIDLNAFELEMSGEPGREYLLRELLEQVKNDYDYIIIDCSPSLGLVALNALTASDSYLVPLLPHHLSIQGLSKLLEVTQKIKTRINPKLELEGVLLTQFSHRKVMHRDIAEVIKHHFGSKLYKTFIRENIALAEAPSAGVDIFRYAPKSNGAEDYFNLCEEFSSKQY
jgi:chromosome partitioning protein